MRVTMPKHSLYVGELVPVQVKAYFRAGTAASLNGLPLLGSDAFSLGKLGEHPAQSQEMVDGQPFTVLHGLYWLVANLAAERPLVLLVDDIHWAEAIEMVYLPCGILETVFRNVVSFQAAHVVDKALAVPGETVVSGFGDNY